MEYTKLKQLPGIMIAYDFEKVFDSLSWYFVFKALKSFNFGESFIKWVSALYSNVSIALELLLVKIRSDKDIRGITVENKETKLAAFDDGLTTFLKDIDSFERLSITLGRFGICSSLKLNVEETEGLVWLRSN